MFKDSKSILQALESSNLSWRDQPNCNGKFTDHSECKVNLIWFVFYKHHSWDSMEEGSDRTARAEQGEQLREQSQQEITVVTPVWWQAWWRDVTY